MVTIPTQSVEGCMKDISEELRAQWLTILRDVPVSINNLYGDPMIQWGDTVQKLESLARSGHTGPVGIIIKGVVTPDRARVLREFIDRGLQVVVLVSISELYPRFENVPMAHRYRNLAVLREAGVSVIAYVRPMTPPYNTAPEVIDRIFTNLAANGAMHVVASGFRGDDAIVRQMSPDEHVEWVLRVKQMNGEVFTRFLDHCTRLGMHLFTRTSCGVCAVLGRPDYNPYLYSPRLVRCSEVGCPNYLNGSCQPVTAPKPGSIELLRYLGYTVSLMGGDCTARCQTTGENRLQCPSCCTTCWVLPVPAVYIEGQVRLGDLTFGRFLTGMLTRHRGCNDTGDKDVGRVTMPRFPEVEVTCLNSWWPMARWGETCFRCEYCILQYYRTGQAGREFGFPPASLLDRIGL